jgi:hypothetical protein
MNHQRNTAKPKIIESQKSTASGDERTSGGFVSVESSNTRVGLGFTAVFHADLGIWSLRKIGKSDKGFTFISRAFFIAGNSIVVDAINGTVNMTTDIGQSKNQFEHSTSIKQTNRLTEPPRPSAVPIMIKTAAQKSRNSKSMGISVQERSS